MKKLPEFIVEIGVNYFDIAAKESLPLVEAAKLMVLKAKEAGADAVKFQSYKAEKLAAKDSPAYWDTTEEPTRSQRELFSKFDKLGIDDYKNISDYCRHIGVEFMSTPFDTGNALNIDKLVWRHKIASADITNYELLSLIGSFKKPVLLSTGASTKEEINTAVNVLKQSGAAEITLLHCVLNYPTPITKANLWKITSLKSEFPELGIGYSDHTKFNKDILLTAWILGAEVIEKHFTLDKTLRGNDHYHAASPDDVRELLSCFRTMQGVIGDELLNWYDPSEEQSRRFARRGVYLVRDVAKEEPLTPDDAEFLRPQDDGITPMEWIKRVAKQEKYQKNMKKGERIT